MSATDALFANNSQYAETFENGDLPVQPALRVAVLACMDARLDIYRILGLSEGEAHVLRNAGGAATDDAIRSLAVSQRELGTEEIVVIHHAHCGMLGFDDTAFRDQVERDAGVRPPWGSDGFPDADSSARAALKRISESPFLPHRDKVRGFVYEESTGRLREITMG